jgi:putative N6-adenine-specific DNA methylase
MPQNSNTPETAFEKRIRRHVNGRVRAYYAITPPGLEKVCHRELTDLGFSTEDMGVESGGATFTGRFVDCMKANLHLRTATRVLMRISSFSATNRRQLEKKVSKLSWELLLPARSLPLVKARSIKSRLYHTQAITESVLAGVISRTGEMPTDGCQGIHQTLFVRVVNDRVTLSLDSSGEPLYKRGVKKTAANAPIRETLAAAILKMAGYNPKRPLVDPMCGSGTFSLEACLMAKQMAPGCLRSFSFMGWPAYREKQWVFEKRNAESAIVTLDTPLIYASDMDPAACKMLEETVVSNHFSDAVSVRQMDFFDCRPSLYGEHSGLITINPPYGKRLGTLTQAKDLFNDICEHLVQHFKGWSVALISPRPGFTGRLPFSARRLPLLHGGLKLTLLIGAIN